MNAKKIITFFVLVLMTVALLLLFFKPITAEGDQEQPEIVQNTLPLNSDVLTKDEIEMYVYQQAEINGIDPDLFVAICKSESGFDKLAKNPNSSAQGLFQIIKGTQAGIEKRTGKKYDVLKIEDNVEMAIWLFKHHGTSPWNASKSGWSK
jgi:hypothetical protein